jgi:hypothetical protein
VIRVEKTEEIPRKRGIGKGVLHEDGLRQEGKMARHVETAVGCETAGKGLVETDGFTASAG